MSDAPWSRCAACRHSHRFNRDGYSLVEALVALTVALMASSALLLALETSLGSSADSVDITIAEGLAQQVLDEILSKRYMAAGTSPTSNTLGRSSSEINQGYGKWDDIDDFHNWTTSLVDQIARARGTGNDTTGLRAPSFMVPTHFFTRWRMRTDVYYIDPVTLERLSSGTSTHRRVEVILQKQTASGTWQTLAAKQRTVAWVPVYAG